MRNAYGLICLLLGVALILAQIIAALIEARRAEKLAEVARTVEGAAKKTEIAAGKARQAIGAIPSQEYVRNLLGQNVDLAALEVSQAEDTAAEAEEEAKSAKEVAGEAATGSSKYDFASALAGKVPLAVSGILLIALGALIMGYIDLSATAST